MNRTAFAGFALASLLFSQGAQARSDTDMIYSVDQALLKELALAEGHTVTEEKDFKGPSLTAKTPEGLYFNFIAADCPEGSEYGCLSLMMQVRYDEDKATTLENVNNANFNEAAVSTWWLKEDKELGFTRFVHLNGGVTWLNLKHNLRLLFEGTNSALNSFEPAKTN